MQLCNGQKWLTLPKLPLVLIEHIRTQRTVRKTSSSLQKARPKRSHQCRSERKARPWARKSWPRSCIGLKMYKRYFFEEARGCERSEHPRALSLQKKQSQRARTAFGFAEFGGFRVENFWVRSTIRCYTRGLGLVFL